jgi:hypothetical protein
MLKNEIPREHPRLREILYLELACRLSWSTKDCNVSDAQRRTVDNPALGLCVMSALVAQDYFGGRLANDKPNDHYWLETDYGPIDFTREQFENTVRIQKTRTRQREELLEGVRAEEARTKKRYLSFKSKVEENLTFLKEYYPQLF